jgi:2-polyprenyl-3-methyl-5-hydroxy-6-metoxy-1,4-benzoquinol methylase
VQVFGLMMVRNEADIVRVNLQHHLALGIDQVLIVDNGSTDDTPEILEELSRDTGRVHWTRDEGPYRQAEITSELAREACSRGADWVLPIDADEFWHAPGGDLRAVLEGTEVGALEVQVVNFVQRREQLEATPDALLHMTRRVAQPVGPLERIAELVETRQIGFVQMMYPPKYVSRASPALVIGMGNHTLRGVAGTRSVTDQIVCLHAPLRARSVLEEKMVDHGRRSKELALPPGQWWHVVRWQRLGEDGALDWEWWSNSYAHDHLHVYGVPHPVVFDSRLRDVVCSWIELPSDATVDASEECSRLEVCNQVESTAHQERGLAVAQDGVRPAANAARYELDIDVASDSTHAMVVRLVGTHKRVLELGCATGYMSRVFRERGCSVVGLEVDQLAAAEAAAYCERVVIGDAEQLDLHRELGDDRFDVIVAADFLEHLRDPGAFLTSLKPFFRSDGYLVASIPNVAHGSVRLALLSGSFPYGDVGLLDRTHLRFYTRESMEQLFDEADFMLTRLERKEHAIDQTELQYDRTAVPSDLLESLASDPEARTYQFVVIAYPLPSGGLQFVQQRTRELAAEQEIARGQIAKQRSRIDQLSAAVSDRNRLLEERDRLLEERARLLEQREQVVQELEALIEELRADLHRQQSTRGWLLLTSYWRARDRLRSVLPGRHRA